MDPATSAGWQCGGVYWFYLEFVDLSHNSLSVIGVKTSSGWQWTVVILNLFQDLISNTTFCTTTKKAFKRQFRIRTCINFSRSTPLSPCGRGLGWGVNFKTSIQKFWPCRKSTFWKIWTLDLQGLVEFKNGKKWGFATVPFWKESIKKVNTPHPNPLPQGERELIEIGLMPYPELAF